MRQNTVVIIVDLVDDQLKLLLNVLPILLSSIANSRSTETMYSREFPNNVALHEVFTNVVRSGLMA